MSQLKVLLFDIETAPITAYVWGRRDVNVAINQIKKDWHLLSFAAKWLGDSPDKTMYYDQRGQKHVEDDKKLLRGMWKLLDEADVVITHNGRQFDSRKLNARFILNGMPPPSPYRHFDTLTLARSVADFTSNSLEYLTDQLCTKYKKLKHDKYPGMELWKACLDGDKKVWKELKKYNIYDVLSLEELYYKIRAWAPANSPAFFVSDGKERVCIRCGGKGFKRRGWRYYTRTKTRRLQCLQCKKWCEGEKITNE